MDHSLTPGEILNELKSAVRNQKLARIDPPPDTLPDLLEIYKVLVSYDQHVTVMVIQAIQGKSEYKEFPSKQILDVFFDKNKDLTDERQRWVKLYSAYKKRLDKMASLVLRLDRL